MAKITVYRKRTTKARIRKDGKAKGTKTRKKKK